MFNMIVKLKRHGSTYLLVNVSSRIFFINFEITIRQENGLEFSAGPLRSFLWTSLSSKTVFQLTAHNG